MNNTFTYKPELDAIIEEYSLKVYGDKVGTKFCPKSKVETLRGLIAKYKAELMEYIPAKDAYEKAEEERKTANFNAVAGVQELREARRTFHADREKFTRQWERGDVITASTKSGETVKALEEKYPLAVFALKVDGERYGRNYEIAGIAQRAYDRIREGEDVEKVKADYDADKSAFADRHLWD